MKLTTHQKNKVNKIRDNVGTFSEADLNAVRDAAMMALRDGSAAENVHSTSRLILSIINPFLKQISIEKEKQNIIIKKVQAPMINKTQRVYKKVDTLSVHEIDKMVVGKWTQIQQSAQKRNLDFDLSLETIRRLLLQKHCSFTRVLFSNKSDSLRSRTFDRRDPNKGYVEGNVVAVTSQMNSFKNVLFELQGKDAQNITPKQLIEFAKQMDKIF